jgi:hypothetical protein
MGDGLGVECSGPLPTAAMDSAAPSAAVEASLGGGGYASLRASARPGRRCEEPLERRRRLVVAAALMVGAALLAGTLASPHGSMASMPSPCSWPPRGSPAAWRRGRNASDDDAGGPTSAVNCRLPLRESHRQAAAVAVGALDSVLERADASATQEKGPGARTPGPLDWSGATSSAGSPPRSTRREGSSPSRSRRKPRRLGPER